jgi:uncharacterized protein YndB with AHSA1/START domain
MSVTSIDKDPEALTLTVTAHLDATVERAWQLWADPRQFERWWGPPTFPTTVLEHDLRTGGRVTFSMGDPDGEHLDNSGAVVAADPPRHLELRDADVDADGRPNDGNGAIAMVIAIDERAEGGAVMVVRTRFESLEGMEQALATGYPEGTQVVFSQMDQVLAAPPA